MAETETKKWHVAVSDHDGDIEWLHCHCTDGKHTRLKEILWRDEGADYLNALEACAEALDDFLREETAEGLPSWGHYRYEDAWRCSFCSVSCNPHVQEEVDAIEHKSDCLVAAADTALARLRELRGR